MDSGKTKRKMGAKAKQKVALIKAEPKTDLVATEQKMDLVESEQEMGLAEAKPKYPQWSRANYLATKLDLENKRDKAIKRSYKCRVAADSTYCSNAGSECDRCLLYRDASNHSYRADEYIKQIELLDQECVVRETRKWEISRRIPEVMVFIGAHKMMTRCTPAETSALALYMGAATTYATSTNNLEHYEAELVELIAEGNALGLSAEEAHVLSGMVKFTGMPASASTASTSTASASTQAAIQ